MILIIQITGCAGIAVSYLSKPYSDDGKVSENGLVNVDAVELLIRPKNQLHIGSGVVPTFPLPPIPIVEDLKSNDFYYINSYYNQQVSRNPSNFFVELRIKPKVDGVSFDPNGIILKISNSSFSPVNFMGPMALGPLNSRDRYTYDLCSPDNSDKLLTLNMVQLTRANEYCFAVEYNRPPPLPNEEFAIEVGGLKTNKKTVSIPLIKYKTELSKRVHN